MGKTIFGWLPIPARWFNAINGSRLDFSGTDPENLRDGQYLKLRSVDLDWSDGNLAEVFKGTGDSGSRGADVGSILWTLRQLDHTYLKADASYLNPTDYPELFGLIGYTYGQSGGNFRLPLLTSNGVTAQIKATTNLATKKPTLTLSLGKLYSFKVNNKSYIYREIIINTDKPFVKNTRVDYTLSGTSVNGEDYNLPDSYVVFYPGETVKLIQLKPPLN